MQGLIGIDPGLDAAPSRLIGAAGVEGFVDAPTPAATAAAADASTTPRPWLRSPAGCRRIELAVIEAVGPMPRQGVASTFRFGYGFGLWMGVLAALRIPHQAVAPQAWKRVVLAGTAKDKAAAIAFAARRHPDVSLLATPRSRVPHDGLADAVCLAEYGRRLLLVGLESYALGVPAGPGRAG